MAHPDRDHPIFGRLKNRPQGALEAITERRIEQAREDGLFDNLPGHGKPIPDIDRQRPPGWFAQRLVTSERTKLKAIRLEDELRSAKPALWRLASAEAVVARVAELNSKVDAYNRVTTLQPMPRLDVDDTVATWRRLRN